MGRIKIQNPYRGHTTIELNTEEAIKEAQRIIDTGHYALFEQEGEDYTQVKTLNPEAETILVPQLAGG